MYIAWQDMRKHIFVHAQHILHGHTTQIAPIKFALVFCIRNEIILCTCFVCMWRCDFTVIVMRLLVAASMIPMAFSVELPGKCASTTVCDVPLLTGFLMTTKGQ